VRAKQGVWGCEDVERTIILALLCVNGDCSNVARIAFDEDEVDDE